MTAPSSPNGGNQSPPHEGLRIEAAAAADMASSIPSSPSVGRIKAPPVCSLPSLKKEAMSSNDLSKLCFPPDCCDCTEPTAATSSASSISSRESEPVSSAQLNAKVISQKVSRQGRETQRWVTDGNQLIRLVTGCVPILQDGRVLFVSASRKAEWILPKGGWELDETMEESAVRESFEEAGVLGTLGNKLEEIQYETRKSKKRRLEMEEKKPSGFFPEDEHAKESPPKEKSEAPTDKKTEAAVTVATPAMSADAVDRIRASSGSKCEETSSVASIASDGSTQYSLVRMTLFPLYVCQVKDDWPESGRFRKAMHIDDAIQMMKSRPEFHAALTQVKEKGLHLVKPNAKTL